MNPSVAELQASLLKAARGMGLALGVGEDIATAAPFILAADEPNETLAQLLQQMESGQISDVITAIDTALVDGAATLTDTIEARALVASASYKMQRVLVLINGRIEATDAAKIDKAIPRRETIDDGLWEQLQGFAARTYVPATDASRLKGAGAGLSDND